MRQNSGSRLLMRVSIRKDISFARLLIPASIRKHISFATTRLLIPASIRKHISLATTSLSSYLITNSGHKMCRFFFF